MFCQGRISLCSSLDGIVSSDAMPTYFIDVQLHELSIANIRDGTGLHVWVYFTWQRHDCIDDKPLHVQGTYSIKGYRLPQQQGI